MNEIIMKEALEAIVVIEEDSSAAYGAARLIAQETLSSTVTIKQITAENSVLWQTLEHIAAMTGENYCLSNATSLAQFAVESKDSSAEKKICAGCGCEWHHDSVWCPECAIKRADASVS